MTLQDRWTRGMIGGTIAAIIMNLINNIFYSFNWSGVRFLDWAAVLIYGHRPEDFLQTAFAQVGQILFAALVGVIFAYLIPRMTSMNYLLKGWFFSVGVWFLSYAATVLFRAPSLTRIGLDSAITTFIGASAYGLVLAYTLKLLDERLKQ